MNSNQENFKRFYIFTGKGGVGKTTSSLAFANYLKSKKQKVLFMDFEGESKTSICKELEIDYTRLDLFKSLELYISIKLNSKLVASWITSTEFFRSIINIVPGMSYLIYLGHIMDMLKNDDELIVVLDSPSSGHALMMLQSAFHYKDIFRAGILFGDIQKMLVFSMEPKTVSINICTIPTELAVCEMDELQNSIKELNFHTRTFLNLSLRKTFDTEKLGIESFGPVKEKIIREQKFSETYPDMPTLPYIIEKDEVSMIHKLSESTKGLA